MDCFLTCIMTFFDFDLRLDSPSISKWVWFIWGHKSLANIFKSFRLIFDNFPGEDSFSSKRIIEKRLLENNQ